MRSPGFWRKTDKTGIDSFLMQPVTNADHAETLRRILDKPFLKILLTISDNLTRLHGSNI